MNIIIFTHPDFVGSKSMARSTSLIYETMTKLGHETRIIKPKPVFYTLGINSLTKKWLGYIDQYLLFPIWVKWRVIPTSKDCLFVFVDQALGPWVPLIKGYKHIVHCNDFLALKSAHGLIKENPTGISGVMYQKFIKWGFRQSKNFISISQSTKFDLENFVGLKPKISEVVYLANSQSFLILDAKESRLKVEKRIGQSLNDGYILHVGGNQWYKNRKGVMEIYEAFRKKYSIRVPLILLGIEPEGKLAELIQNSSYKGDIFTIINPENDFLNYAYSGASVFLFPSLAEGFGWPIIEAMSSGCPVITTNQNPMKEVGGEAAYYIPVRYLDSKLSTNSWSNECAKIVKDVVCFSETDKHICKNRGLENCERFDLDIYAVETERIYKRVMEIN